jgi:hypothetical protein
MPLRIARGVSMERLSGGPLGHERVLADRLRHVLWIGGGTGAGKTSIASALAERHGLQPYYYDFHDARDHSERIDPHRHRTMHAFRSMSMDERWVLRTPEEMARETIEASRERMAMVVEDLLARPAGVPIVAEGFGFFPEFIAPWLTSDRQAIWLVPTAEFRARALGERGWSLEGTSDSDRARANKLARDALLTDHVRRSAEALGLRVIEVDGTRSLAEVTATVAEHVAPVLRSLAPETAASDRATDDGLRRTLVRSFMPFIARCTRGYAVLERVAERHQLAAHQLGLLNSAYLAAGRGPVSERGLRDAVPYATRSRLGAEHWQPLIAAGLASAHVDGWAITDAGHDTVAELYREVWGEVASRSANPALVGRIGEILERLSYAVPLAGRARFIRDVWGEAPATTLVRLYRAVWELSIYRDACFRAAWEAEGYGGATIDVLTQVWDGASTVEGIAVRLAAKQDRDSVHANLALLESRGDLQRAGDSVALTDRGRATRDGIEARTDAASFERWPTGVRLQALVDDFDALMRSL